MVLDYSRYNTYKNVELHGDWWAYAKPKFNHFQHCVFCKNPLTRQMESETDVEPGEGWNDISIIYDCLNCGWWFYQNEAMSLSSNGQYTTHNELSFSGILRKYNISDKEIPLNILKQEIQKNNNLLYNINPYTFEKFVADIFKDFYNCEVKHIGKSHDGGIDLILIRSDGDIIVQVKRREASNYVESVSVIRELIGSMILSKNTRAIFVSTAEKYSKEAIKAALRVKLLGAATSFTLLDFKKFSDILKLSSKPPKRAWELLLSELNSHEFKFD